MNPWIVSHDQTYLQSDGHNCGPIVEIFGAIAPGTIESVGTNPNYPDETYRSIVMNYYESRLKLFDSVLCLEGTIAST